MARFIPWQVSFKSSPKHGVAGVALGLGMAGYIANQTQNPDTLTHPRDVYPGA